MTRTLDLNAEAGESYGFWPGGGDLGPALKVR
jgi:hypothetical protein